MNYLSVALFAGLGSAVVHGGYLTAVGKVQQSGDGGDKFLIAHIHAAGDGQQNLALGQIGFPALLRGGTLGQHITEIGVGVELEYLGDALLPIAGKDKVLEIIAGVDGPCPLGIGNVGVGLFIVDGSALLIA